MLAGFHLALTTGLFFIGRLSIVPSQFDGNGFGRFAVDNYLYQVDITPFPLTSPGRTSFQSTAGFQTTSTLTR